MAYDGMQISSGSGFPPDGSAQDAGGASSLAQKFQQEVAATTGAGPAAVQGDPAQGNTAQDGPPALSGFAPTPSFQDARAAALQAALTAPSGAAASSQAGSVPPQAGPVVTRSYAASGALLATTTTQADGSSTVLVQGTGQGWTSVLNSYDAAGRMTEQQVHYADQHVDDMVLDPASQQVVGSTSTDGSGHLTQKSVQHPDGTATQTGYDAAGVADKVTTWNADGSSTVLETNTASQPYGWQSWSTTQGTYNAAGTLTDQVAHNLDGSTTTSHYDVAHDDALQFQTTRNADGSSMDMVEDTSGTQTYSAYDVYKDAAGHITSQNIFGRDGSLQTTLYDASGTVQSSTTQNADHSSSVVTENADGSVRIDDYTAAGQLADEAVAHADKSVTKTVYQTVNGTAAASATYQFNADGSWVENDLDDALAGSPLLVQQVHNVDGTQTDYVHAPQGGQSYSSYTVQKDANGRVTEEDIQGTDGSYTQDLYAAGKLAKSTRDATDGSYAITYLNTSTQPWAFQTYSYNAQGQYVSAVSDYAATAGKASYWTQDTWTPGTETWTGQSTHYDNGTEYDVVIGAASDPFSFYTVGKDAAGVVRQQTIVNADGSTVVLGSDKAGHIDTRTILPAGGGFDQEVVNAAGQTSAIVSHGADGSQIVQAFTTGAAAQALSYQSLSNAQGVETDALLVGSDGSRDEETYGADGRVASASVTRGDGTVVSAATYGAGGVQASATVLNADGSHTVTDFDAQGHVQRVSFTHDDGSGASFVVEAGGSITPGQAVLNQVSVALEEQILAQPVDDKHTVSQKVTLPDGELYNVTMGAGGNIFAKHEHPSGIVGDIEEVAGVVADVLTFVPGLNEVGVGLAIGLGAIEGGQELAGGNVVGGLLSLAGAAAGASGAPPVVGRLVATAQGVDGLITGAESGDIGTAIASGLGGLGAAVDGFDPGLGQLLLASSALTSVGVAASHGDVLAALGPLITAVATGVGGEEQVASGPNADDPFAGPGVADAGTDAGAAVGAGAAPGDDASGADPFPGPGVDGTPAAAALANASDASIGKAAQDAAAAAAPLASGGTGTGGDGVAASGSDASSSTGGEPTGPGQAGLVANGAPDVSRQSGGLPATNSGVTTDPSGRVHIDVAPVATGYAPGGDATGGAAAGGQGTVSGEGPSKDFGDVTVRLGPTGLVGDGSGTATASEGDGSSLTLAGTNLPRIVTRDTPAQASVPGTGQGGSGGTGGGGTGLASGTSAGQAGTPTMGDVTGLPGLDGMTQDGTALPGSGDSGLPTARQLWGAGKVVAGSVEEVAGGLAVGTGGVFTGIGVLATPEGVGIPVTAGGVGLMAAGAGAVYAGSQLVQGGRADMSAPTFAPMSTSDAGSTSAPPVVVPSNGSLAGAPVNTGDLSTMTGLGANIIPANPGFTPAPPLPPLPGFTPTPDSGQGAAGGIETLPIDTTVIPTTTANPASTNRNYNILPGLTIGGQELPTLWASTATSSTGNNSPVSYNISTEKMSSDEKAAVIEYAQRTNEWLAANGPATIQPTAGTLRSQASAAARSERLAAARAGQPYQGQAGHVPDTAITGTANPPAGWLDMPGISNSAVGGGLTSRIGKVVTFVTVDGKVP